MDTTTTPTDTDSDVREARPLAGPTSGLGPAGSTSFEERRNAMLGIHRAADEGDWDTVLAAYDPAIVWINPPTAGPWAGRFDGIDAVATMFAEYLAFFEGTATQEVVDVCVSADRTISLIHERGTRSGHVYDNQAMWICHHGPDGRVVEVVAVDRDLDAAAAFWDEVT